MDRLQFEALPAVRSEGDFVTFVHGIDRALDTIQQAQTRLTWAKIQGEPTAPAAQEQIDRASEGIYTRANHETIQAWKDRLSDPYLHRWATVLDRAFTLNLIEQQPELRHIVNHVNDRYLRWRPTVNGREISYTEHTWIARFEPDRDIRREAYLAFWDLGNELIDVTRQMFELRNAAAQALGYPTYADLKLDLVDGVSRQWVIDQFDEMDRVTAETSQAFLSREAERAGIAVIEPWDTQYLWDRDPWPDNRYYPADRLEANLFDAMRSIGLDSPALGISLHWYDSQWGGQCMTVAPRDIRILVGKSDGMLNYNTAFHEYGHAAHAAYNAQPYTLRHESGMFTEGMAMFMERFLHYPTWMRRTGVPEPEIQAYRATWKLPRIYRHRRLAPMVLSEFAAWDDPTQDLDRVFGETTARYLGCAYQPRPFASVARWTRPVQLQSYFIADLIASQTHAYLRRHAAPIYDSTAAIEHVREHYWKPGNSIPWLDKIVNCTGKALSYADLGRDMVEPVPDVP
jgi:hypothetical protein